jgi:hypothetical protein
MKKVCQISHLDQGTWYCWCTLEGKASTGRVGLTEFGGIFRAMEAIQLYTNQFNKYFCSRKSDSTICIDWYSTSCFYKPKYFIEFSPGYSNFPGGILPAVNWCVFDTFDLCLFAVFEHSMPKQNIKMKQIDKAAVFSITLFNSIFSDFLISKIRSYVFFFAEYCYN